MRNKIFCGVCNNDNNMEVSEVIGGNVYCSCVKCGTEKRVKEFTKEVIDDNEYTYSSLHNAYYRKCNLTKRYFYKVGFTKKGTLQKKPTIVSYQDRDYEYLEKNIA